MPTASQRAADMPSSPIRRLMPLAVAAEQRGTHVHYLNIGQPDIPSPESFWDGIRSGMVKTLAYSASQGTPDLRAAALDDYRRRGMAIEADQFVVTTGGSEATLFAFLSCFDPGDEVIVVEPYYANYSGFAIQAGVKLVALTTKIEENFRLPAIDDIAREVTPRTRGILVCNPSNPTGTSFSEAQLRELGDLAVRKNLFLIVDEVYRDFNYLDTPLVSVLNLPGLAEHAVMIDSASKRFSLCGSRVGFLVSRNKSVIDGAVKLSQARLSGPTLEQGGLANALRNTPESYSVTIRTEYMYRRDVLVSELRKLPDVIVPDINGAFYAFVRLPVDDAETFCKFLLADFCHEGETVLMAPGEGFYLTPGLGRNEVRIAYVLEAEKIKAAIRCIGAGLGAYPGTFRPAIA